VLADGLEVVEYVGHVLLFATRLTNHQQQKGKGRGRGYHLVEGLEKGKTNPGGFH
jgi:hypothetical protein